MSATSVRYARSGETHVAYQVVGDGPVDVIFVWGGVSHLELAWEHQPTAMFFENLASFSRLIILDKRGTGLSDRPPFSVDLESRMDDVRAVLDDLGSTSTFVFGESEAAGLAALFAATHPDRVQGLLLYGPLVRVIADEAFPWAHTAEAFDRYVETCTRHWGDGLMMSLHSPSTTHDSIERDYWARLERSSMSPGGFADHMRALRSLDIRPVLPLVHVPTLVLHRRDDPTVPFEQGEFVAREIPSAELVELDGSDHYPMIGQVSPILEAVRAFVRSDHPASTLDIDRVLTTVLFTDIVGSTETLAAVGDSRWTKLIEMHDQVAQTEVRRHRGRVVRSTGDGVFATFDGPARAVRCARSIKEAASRIGLEIRAGIHCGEVEMSGVDIAGIAVHTAARVQSEAAPGELLVSRTVVDLVAGSGLTFLDRGTRSLRGVPGEWHLFAVGA
ncbi:MAG: adenylate/guanylate cyclase domain-containing protein [Acidimicrobiales bacterium]